ncbi:DUF4302 domain-containing protein [Capnocytophaga gingivalis]|jgi:hypothetical protein|uniref:DUF4302 domain-containing protein n=1 Tax=Capnocytophaga gingivalis TaxID=1017 RepID=A0ABU5YD44_9FLAO|nr:DUF4302 domain-containing protein [Capnocytophaga gingivalis]MEB3040583.1 DUF4302 domain-containing protein [Capnocytophaga gingivalis]
MKKYIYMCLAACLLVSCSQEEEAVYGKGNSYAKRTGETSTEYVNLLEGAPNGWLLSMYVGTGQQYGGYNYILKFHEGNVTALSEATTEEDTSLYTLNFSEKSILTFDTYNKVLHQFVEPSALFPEGKIGDNQLVIQSYENGVFTLKGQRSNNLMTLRKLEGEATAYLSKIRERQSLFKVSDAYPVTINGKEVDFELQPSNRQFIAREGTTVIKKAYIYTENGFKLYEPITIAGKTFSEFTLSADNSEITADDASIKTRMVYNNLPFDFYNGNIKINMLDDLCSSNAAFVKIYNLYKTVKSRNIAPYFYLGKLSPSEDIAMNFTIYYYDNRNYKMRYLLDFLPVAGKSDQVNIVPVEQGFYWNYYGNYPLVEVLTQNAPYQMTDVNGDGTLYKFTSTKNSEVTFLSHNNATLPYDPSQNEWKSVDFQYASDALKALYNTYKTHTVTKGNASATYRLQDSMSIGYGSLWFTVRRGTSSATVSYAIDALAVPCDTNQVSFVDKGATYTASSNWTTYNYLSPIVNFFLQNGPFKVEDVGGGWTKFTSAKNSDYWFYTR